MASVPIVRLSVHNLVQMRNVDSPRRAYKVYSRIKENENGKQN